MITVINRAGLRLGTEIFKCPKCLGPVPIEIHTDLPEQDWLSCPTCGYRALVNTIPILDKYGLPHGLSLPEKRQLADHLQRNIAKM